MKGRLLGDAAFPAKLATEAGMGLVTKIIAELQKRPDKFLAELDLVFANVIMSLISDIMLVWIPAPQANLSCHTALADGQFLSNTYALWARCPANAFQVAFFPSLVQILHQLTSCLPC